MASAGRNRTTPRQESEQHLHGTSLGASPCPVAASASLDVVRPVDVTVGEEAPTVRSRAVVPGPVVPDRRDERPCEHLPLRERAAHEVPDPVGLVRATRVPVGHPAFADRRVYLKNAAGFVLLHPGPACTLARFRMP